MITDTILEHLQNSTELTAYLARYDGKAAIFQNLAPENTDAGWESQNHYSQLLLRLNMREDFQREGKSTLTVEVATDRDSRDGYPLMDAVRERLDGWFFNAGGRVVSARWAGVSEAAARDEMTRRTVITFALIEYPDQGVLPESPAALLGVWSKGRLPEVIGRPIYLIDPGDGSLPQAFRPTEQKPAVYWRLVKTGKCESLTGGKGVMWRSALVHCHIVIPGRGAEADAMALLIERALLAEGRVENEDGFVIIGDMQGLDLSRDPVQAGQLALEAVYPVIAENNAGEKLQHVSVAMRERE